MQLLLSQLEPLLPAVSKPIIMFVTAMLSAGTVGDYKPAQRAAVVVGRSLEEPMSLVSALLPARLVLNTPGKVQFCVISWNGWIPKCVAQSVAQTI